MDFSGLQIPVYSNYTSQPYDNNIKYLITNQINHPVMWEKIIKNMIADGFNIFIETGVGNTLKKLVSRISSDVLVLSFDKFEQLPDIKEAIKNA